MAPFGLGRPLDADRRGRADVGVEPRLLRGGRRGRRGRDARATGRWRDGRDARATGRWRDGETPGATGPRRDLGRRDLRLHADLDPRLGHADLPPADRHLRGLERHAVEPRGLGDSLGVVEDEFDLLRLLPLLFQQELVAGGPGGDDPGGLAGDRGLGDRRVGQPQRNLVPALGQQADLDHRLHADHVLRHGGLVVDLGNQGPDGRLDRGRDFSVLGRLPQLLELLVGEEHPAALFLEGLAELLVRDIDRLLAEGLLFLALVRSGRRRRRDASRRRGHLARFRCDDRWHVRLARFRCEPWRDASATRQHPGRPRHHHRPRPRPSRPNASTYYRSWLQVLARERRRSTCEGSIHLIRYTLPAQTLRRQRPARSSLGGKENAGRGDYALPRGPTDISRH